MNYQDGLNKIVDILKKVNEGIQNNDYKSTIDIFEPFVEPSLFKEIKEEFLQKHTNKNSINGAGKEALRFLNDLNENDLNENELDSVLDQDNEEDEELYNKFTPYILQAQEVASKYVKMSSKGAASSLTQLQTPTSSKRESGSSRDGSKKRRSKSGSAFPINWNLIISMASNLTLDQVKSMLGLLIMVLSRTPISVILKELHRYRMFASIISDLLLAIYKLDPREIATQIIIATFAVVSFMNRHDKFLSTVLSVSKYIHSTGAKKKFLFVRFLTLGLFLTNLFKIVNPPPVTPLELIQIVKSQISSKL